MRNGIKWGLFALAGIGFVSMLIWYLFFYRKHGSSKPIKFDYNVIDGTDRKAVIAAFNSVEKHLAKNGFRRRMANESYREYAFAAQLYAGDYTDTLNWLAGTASQAAFSAVELDVADPAKAADHARDLRSTFG